MPQSEQRYTSLNSVRTDFWTTKTRKQRVSYAIDLLRDTGGKTKSVLLSGILQPAAYISKILAEQLRVQPVLTSICVFYSRRATDQPHLIV